jgi:hypothetical protein
MIYAIPDGAVELYYDDTKKFETTSGGVEVSSGNLTMQSNGRIFVGNGGNAVNPMFANVSDTNTGIAFPAADTMLFTTGGSERLRITSTGAINCGHGDAINLHGSTTTGINLNGNGNSGQIIANASDNRALIIGRQASYGQVIEFFQGSNINEAAITIPAADSFGIETAGTERLRITPDGKVGINEDTPSYRLHIKETTGSSNYAFVENTTTGNAGIRLKNSQGDYVVFVGPDFRVYDWTNSVDRLRIDSSGRILKGISSSILGSSDVQLAGNGGPAKIAGYWSNNNPGANSNMLSIGGYSQSGSTFTGVGEIDFRCDQNNATSSGSHSGSIVMRVNGGSTSGTWSGHAYSFAGLKDRERLTRRSKRYYCLPEVDNGSDTYNNFREEWDYQHIVGYNQYTWYRFTSHSSSSSRGGSVDIRVTWHTRHAAGNGYGHYAFHWRDSHANGYMELGNVYRYHQNHLGGSYYGWSGSPQLDVYEINNSGNNAGFYLRLQGHISANGNTYDGGVVHQFTISSHTNRYGADTNNFEFVSNTTPSDVGSLQSFVNLP